MYTAHEYVEAIVRRSRQPMEPLGFEPDWADRPRTHNVYPGLPRIPLPAGSGPVGSVDSALREYPAHLATNDEPAAVVGRLSLAGLGAMLRESYGLGGRRLAPNPNDDSSNRSAYSSAQWSRGTASGGGLYPLEVYWVCGPSGPLLPGVYNYSAPHHALYRLFVGDVTGRVRRALGRPSECTDQFLLVTVKFWKNAFKYNSFCYHAVTMDVGTALGTWQLWSRATGVSLRPALNFDEVELNRLLGLAGHDESVHAVVPLPWAGPSPPLPEPRSAKPPVTAEPCVTVRPAERSRNVIRFRVVEEVHASTIGTVGQRPTPVALSAGAAQYPPTSGSGRIRLPEPVALGRDVRTALRARRSSFGRFSAHRALGQSELGTLLAAGKAGARLVSDIKRADGTPALTHLAVFINHVDGVPPGAYDYDDLGHALAPITSGQVGRFLQRNYLLRNYNLEQAAAVIAVVARPQAVMAAVGQRGYRFVNAEVGAAAQALYTACAAAGLGCGAALGFDNVSYVEHLGGIDRGGAWPLLIMMVGHERRRAPDFHFQLS